MMRVLFYTISCIVIHAFLLFGSLTAQAQYTVEEIPNPKENGQNYYVSNPNGILSSAAESEINQMAVEIEEKTKAEVAVVVVSDFEGDDDFAFAHRLFNTWGIGKRKQIMACCFLLVRTDIIIVL